MKTPCEVFVWYLLPGIRQEMARAMVDDLGMSQAETARLLDITSAAVSQYLSGKRGNVDFPPRVLDEIKASAARIVEAGGGNPVICEICRICEMVKDTEVMARLYDAHVREHDPKCGLGHAQGEAD